MMTGIFKTELGRFRHNVQLQYSSLVAVFVAVSVMLAAGVALGAGVTVFSVAKDGSLGVLAEYRWVIEEDATYQVVPGAPVASPLALRFHSSYMPVVAQGDNTTPLPTLDPNKRYFVSVLPKAPGTYTIGGAPLIGDGLATVYVNALPLPTAQISVFIHEDIDPINNAWDQGERGLEGFNILLEDAGGRYGMSAGSQMADAYGNVLGTVYLQTCDQSGANPGTGTYGCLDIDGVPIVMTDGTGAPVVEPLITGADGSLTIRNLAPGKYGIIAVPPDAQAKKWIQTTTIEGTRVIDAWVKPNEPPFFSEFGPPSPHVSIGFVPAGANNPYVDTTYLTGGATISGQVVNQHLSRPPNTVFYSGAPFPHTTPWVGLNLGAAGTSRGIYAARTDDDGNFAIPNVPPGNYQLVVWDDNLDLLFAFQSITVTGPVPPVELNLGPVSVFQWFTRLENWVYHDQNENGFRDDDEAGILEQAVNLRWRDGSMYQSFPTDGEGFVPFDQVFPFFAWLVAEVDFTRFKATGLTVTVDDGGPITLADPWSWEGQLNPQAQGNPLDPDSLVTTLTYRTEVGPVLTQGFQGFLGQTSVMEWGKTVYGPDENGGISGVVSYAVTRAEDNPEQAVVEPWEPGIPRVTVNLYAYDSAAIDLKGALLSTTSTDSWDDSLPANCQYGVNADSGTDDPYSFRGVAADCYDGMRNWNQIRPGVFDGGYAFGPEIDCASDGAGGFSCPTWVNQSTADPSVGYINAGRYIVEVIPPTGYEVIKSQDRNVDFGDNYIPSPQLLPPQCVGTAYTVPAELTLFPGTPAPLAGQSLSGCESKLVALSDGANAAADFGLFTQVPVAGHIVGMILDDTATEFVADSPNLGEKYAPPFLPVSIRDWTGRMITSTYSGEFGAYNVLVPSTYTANLPKPSGMSPNMLTACMNDPEADTIGGFYNSQYSTFCYTLQYMPGTTTYLDTPVVPISAFAGGEKSPLDCEFTDATPRIFSVTNGLNQGPYLPTTGGTLTITSVGSTQVSNPAYDGVGGVEPKTITRDYGFGAALGQVSIGGVPLTVSSWTEGTITVTVTPGTGTGEMVVTRGDNGALTTNGVTIQVGLRAGSVVQTVGAGQSIQAAIDAAGVNDLILVPPGTYSEMVIMYKPVQLQGWGEGTVISAVQVPTEKLVAWREKILVLDALNAFDPVDGQGDGFGGVEAGAFDTEEGAGILVLANNGTGTGVNVFTAPDNQGARIDGFTIRSASTGGGIVVNGFADYLDISNNRITANSGFFGGGVRIGHPFLTFQDVGGTSYTDSDNDFIRIHNNVIAQNGGLSGAGGGLSLYNGTDDYAVSNNFVCGNFTLEDGAGIAHFGLSNNGVIEDNTILFNENFNQMVTVNGGGLSISGLAPLNQNVTPGSGSVQVARNLIQGNSAGAGDGGGIRLNRINGLDVSNAPADPAAWHTIDIVNNMIFNNVAGLAGGGISLQDGLRVNILHNTIANNDNTSTASEAFAPGILNVSTAQAGAGIVSRSNSAELTAVLPAGESVFSDPVLVDNIIWHNRKFSFLVDDTNLNNVLTGLCPDIDGSVGLACPSGVLPDYDDIAVLPLGSGAMTPVSSILTGNPDPQFLFEYANGDRDASITSPEVPGVIQPNAAFDEGGNFVRLRYGPLTQVRVAGLSIGELYGDHHLQLSSGAINTGTDAGVTDDFDGQARPFETAFDIGADEVQQPAVPGPAPLAAVAQLTSLGGVTPQVAGPVVSPDGGTVVSVEIASAEVTTPPGQPLYDTEQSTEPAGSVVLDEQVVGPVTVVHNEQIADVATVVQAGGPSSFNRPLEKKNTGYAGYQPQSSLPVSDTEPGRDVNENPMDQPLVAMNTISVNDVGIEPVLEKHGWNSALYEDEGQPGDPDDLKVTRGEVKSARKNLKKAIKNMAKVKKDRASVEKDLERAVEDLEQAMLELEKAVDDLTIVAIDLERSLEDPEDDSRALKRVRKELEKARKIMVRAEKDLANVNLKG